MLYRKLRFTFFYTQHVVNGSEAFREATFIIVEASSKFVSNNQPAFILRLYILYI